MTGESNINTITCECGKQILLVPDVKEMNQAIKNHVAEHRKIAYNSKKALEEADRIEDLLITQIFEKAAQE